MADDKLPTRSSSADVSAFLNRVNSTPAVRRAGTRGRLVFAMDATASRQPTWDSASNIQVQMFEDAAVVGGLDVQLVYFRGQGEFEASPWCGSPAELLPRMTGVACRAGITQLEKVLGHGIDEARRQKINAVVYVGDCMEEDPERLYRSAGELHILGVPVFLFQEGNDPIARIAFQEIARLSHGAYCPFDAGSPRQLRDLLTAVAVYAAGGRQALEDLGRRNGAVRQLVHQIDR